MKALVVYYSESGNTEKNVTVLGTFGCRGQVKPSLIDALLNDPEHKAWAVEAQSAIGHPDESDLADGKEFAAWMIAKARNM